MNDHRGKQGFFFFIRQAEDNPSDKLGKRYARTAGMGQNKKEGADGQRRCDSQS